MLSLYSLLNNNIYKDHKMGNSCCYNSSSLNNQSTNFDIHEYQDTLCERETIENSSPPHKVIKVKKRPILSKFFEKNSKKQLTKSSSSNSINY